LGGTATVGKKRLINKTAKEALHLMPGAGERRRGKLLQNNLLGGERGNGRRLLNGRDSISSEGGFKAKDREERKQYLEVRRQKGGEALSKNSLAKTN